VKLLYFDCIQGAAGDMILGALLDAGASEAAVRDSLDALHLPGWQLEIETVQKNGLRAVKANVVSEGGGPERTYRAIRELIDAAALPPRVKERAQRIFEKLGKAEAKVHGSGLDEVHFHEVGGIDAIIDIVGAAAALEALAPERIVTSAIPTGRGTTGSQHGPIPVPAPAVVEMLHGATLFERGTDELITPTGAAILAAMSDGYGALPAMKLTSSGYGAGTRDTVIPNVIRVLIGVSDETQRDGGDHMMVETNLDDMSPELIPYAIERLISAGAEDAWTNPIVMKKGRPAVTLAVLTTLTHLEDILSVIYAETTTLGVRLRSVDKRELQREWVDAKVHGYAVRVKLGRSDAGITNAAPEYEDAVKVARITGLPLKEVYRLALADLSDD
jgi:uncharacterized protein (TIGR00299 family) protein